MTAEGDGDAQHVTLTPLVPILCALRKATAMRAQVFADAPGITICLRGVAPARPFAFRQAIWQVIWQAIRQMKVAGMPMPRQRCRWTEGEAGAAGSGDGWDERCVAVACDLPQRRPQSALARAWSAGIAVRDAVLLAPSVSRRPRA